MDLIHIIDIFNVCPATAETLCCYQKLQSLVLIDSLKGICLANLMIPKILILTPHRRRKGMTSNKHCSHTHTHKWRRRRRRRLNELLNVWWNGNWHRWHRENKKIRKVATVRYVVKIYLKCYNNLDPLRLQLYPSLKLDFIIRISFIFLSYPSPMCECFCTLKPLRHCPSPTIFHIISLFLAQKNLI